jgi:hypothetical protein
VAAEIFLQTRMSRLTSPFVYQGAAKQYSGFEFDLFDANKIT